MGRPVGLDHCPAERPEWRCFLAPGCLLPWAGGFQSCSLALSNLSTGYFVARGPQGTSLLELFLQDDRFTENEAPLRDPDAGKDRAGEEGATEDETVGWLH